MAKTPKKEKQDELLAAIEFCMSASNATPTQAYTSYCCMSAETGTVYMSDGIIACGCYCPVHVTTNPHVDKLHAALKRMESGISVTLLDDSHIIVKSGRLKAVIPTIEYTTAKLMPDPPRYTGDLTTLLWALQTASCVTKDNAENVIHASVLINDRSAFGTDNHLLIECWHGIPIEISLSVPKTFITAISKVKKELRSIGYTDKSITVWYTDNSWIRSQLYENSWPLNNIVAILNTPTNMVEYPTDINTGIDTIKPFLDKDNTLTLTNGSLASASDKLASTYAIPELVTEELRVNVKLLQAVSTYLTHWDLSSHKNKIYFQGRCMRGALCTMI